MVRGCIVRRSLVAVTVLIALTILTPLLVSAAPRQQTVVNICDRTAEVQTAILARVSGATCSTITQTQLAGINGEMSIFGYSSSSVDPSEFAGLSSLEYLNLRNNAIETLYPGAFQDLTSLKGLDFDEGRIKTLEDGVFRGLTSLTSLSMSGNRLTTINPGAFNDLTALDTLRLFTNNITSLDANTFSGLTTLEDLDLSNNPIADLHEDAFDPLTALTRLRLANLSASLMNADWDEDLFESLTNLTYLNIRRNSFTTLDEDLFDDLTNLETLDISESAITALPEDIFDGLTSLTRLNLNHNALTTLPADIFDDLSSLQRLQLNSNSLTSLPADVFDGPDASLQRLYLHSNSITSLDANLFAGLTGLSQLGLSSNELTTVPNGLFGDTTALERLYLNNNMISTLPTDIFDGLTGLKWLLLNNNSLSSLNVDLFDEPTALERLYLHRNTLSSLDETVFDSLTALSGLYLHYNSLTSLAADTFDGLTNLNTLYLNDNNLSTLDADLFDGLGNLKTLYLNDNGLTALPVTLFADLDDTLEQLVLTDNSIAALPAMVFAGLTGLKGLDLSCNSLTVLDLSRFDPFASSLTYLDITDNSFTTAPTDAAVRAKLTSIANLYITDANTECLLPDVRDLSGLTVSAGTLKPAFEAPGFTGGYGVTVAHDATSIVITPTTKDPHAAVTSVPADADMNAAGIQVNLPTDRTRVYFKVTAEDGVSSTDYLIEVFREHPPATNARLTGLTLSGVTIPENFGSRTYAYTGTTSLATTTVTPELSDLDATAVIKLGGVTDADGTVNLALGTNVITVEVTAEDRTTQQTYTVTVTRINSEPMFSADSATRTLPENSGAGVNVVGGVITATDRNSGDTLTYSLTGTDAGSFEIDSSTGQLKTKTGVTHNFDFEAAKKSYSVTVNVSDSKDADGVADTVVDDTIAVTIDLTNVDDAGTVTLPATFSGGVEATASVTDPDGTVSSPSWRWARGNTATGSFGNIGGATSATYTPIAADVGKYLRATVTYTDPQGSGKTASAVSSGPVVAGNAEPTFDDGATATRTLPENSGAGVNVVGGVVAATDSDSGDTLTYSLTGTDAARFEIDSSGQIKVKTGFTHTFNFESSKKSYSVTVNVRDSKDAAGNADTANDDTIAVTINLTNVNEAPTITNLLTESNAPENSSGTILLMVLDVDVPDTQTWSVETTDDGDKFQVAGGFLPTLSFKDQPDFETPSQSGETDNEYVVTVTLTDSGGLSDTLTFTVTVTDVNEAPKITTLAATYTGFNVDENAATTMVIKTYEAEDPDANSVLTWDVHGADAGDFTITKNAQGHGELKFANVPNFESPADTGANNVYDVTVRVRDAGGLSTTLMVQVTVTDVNETPVVSGDNSPDFAEIEYDVLDADLTAANYIIATYSATDDDNSDNANLQTITWDVSGDDAAHFTIDSSSGVLSFSIRPDFENAVDMGSNNTYEIVVEADDGQGESNSVGTFTVTVTVTNVDETPEITTTDASHTAPSFMEIEYDAATADLTVVVYAARDEEDGTTGITWSLTGTDAGDFMISTDSATGMGTLTFRNWPNFEDAVDGDTDNDYEITVRASDTTGTTKTREMSVVVTVTDVNERPDIDEDTVSSYAEIEYDADTTVSGALPDVHTFTAEDYDDGDTYEWSLLGTDAAYLDIDSGTGALTFRQDTSFGHGPLPNFEYPRDDNADGSNTYSIIVRATDNHMKTTDYAVVVTVTDVNEVPEFTGTPKTAITLDEHDANDNYVVMDQADYNAYDEEGGVTWSLTGTDRRDFAISAVGVVTFAETPNFEGPNDDNRDNVYEFTVVATDVQSGSSRRNVSVAVTVTVGDVEEAGTLMAENLSPAAGETVTFRLTDPDGSIDTTNMTWVIQSLATGGSWARVSGVLTPASTTFPWVVDEDVTGKAIRAMVTYTDRRGSGKEAESQQTAEVTADPIVNAPPRFRGVSSWSVEEGPAGGNVGTPTRATDRDNDTLTYGIEASLDSALFEIDPSTGQVRLAQAVDFETMSDRVLFIYLTLHDGRDADGNAETVPTVDARRSADIEVTDVEEDGVVTLSDDEPGVQTAVTATLADGDGGVTGQAWVWARSSNGRTGWTNISGATSSSYTTTQADEDFFLRATVTYTDRRGAGKSAEAVTDDPVPSANRRPRFPSTETGERTVPENSRAGANIGAPVAADDPENDGLTYTLTGTGAGAFTIVATTGQIQVKDDLDFEMKASYSVTVEVHDGRDGMGSASTAVDDTQAVTITVENVEEQGVVTLTTDTGTIQARAEVTAALEDGDGVTGSVGWQWARSPDGRTDWVNIAGATSAAYTPTLEEDRGNYIRATATYTDGHGPNKTAEKVSARVGDPPPVNSAPVFPSTEDGRREVAENAADGTAVGAPVAATDLNAGDSAVNDPLAYALSGTDATSFTIDSGTGQLRVASGVMLDFEDKRTYRVTVEVTDGRDQNGDADMAAVDARQNVIITVTNVNEAPEVTGDATVSYQEDANRAIATYSAADPERDTLTWTVSNTTDFWVSQRGQLHFRAPPSFETQTNYTVTVTATDDATPPLSGTLSVTVTVTDAEEEGTITIEPTRGWDGTPFRADLTDDDDGITNEVWQWERSPNGRSGWTAISGAISYTYSATTNDVGQYLRATVSYEDNRGSGKEASATVTGRIEDSTDRPASNNAPTFADASAERSVGQGTAAGRSVGAPVRADDEDPGDVLTYSLSGTDALLFVIDPTTGQIRTKDVLDYDPDGTNTYSVTVGVHDGYGPDYQSTDVGVDATITVTITVTAVSQRSSGGSGGGGGGGFGPAPTAPKFVDGFRTERPLAVTARPGDAVGDPVSATHPNDDDVTYSLSGANAALFTVDAETGQIRLGQGATLEVGQTYTVNLTATDSTGTGAIIIVVIAVAEGVGDPYDLNRNGTIEKDEVLTAIADYFAGLIEKDEVLELVARYFAA